MPYPHAEVVEAEAQRDLGGIERAGVAAGSDELAVPLRFLMSPITGDLIGADKSGGRRSRGYAAAWQSVPTPSAGLGLEVDRPYSSREKTTASPASAMS